VIAVVLRPVWRYMLRPVWTLVAPPLRFIGARLTPGELGIELTTLLAIAGVCIYTVALQINLLETDALLFGDETTLEIARDIEVGILTTLSKVLAVIGRLWFVVLVTAAVCAYLLSRRRAAEAVALSAGLAITQITTQIIKGAVDRPRPGDGLVGADGFAYPSGHASIAVTYLAIAVILSRTVPAAWRVGLVVAGTVLAVAIGLSRAYLRVHYLTDVVGGWAVGLAAFSLCGAVALVVDYLRHNSDAPEAQSLAEWTASQSPTSSSERPA
jgi:undecaprenyl-diphosphatase